jgi:hypothetical protein
MLFVLLLLAFAVLAIVQCFESIWTAANRPAHAHRVVPSHFMQLPKFKIALAVFVCLDIAGALAWAYIAFHLLAAAARHSMA